MFDRNRDIGRMCTSLLRIFAVSIELYLILYLVTTMQVAFMLPIYIGTPQFFITDQFVSVQFVFTGHLQ